MLSKTFNVLFYLKKRSNYVEGKLPIYLRVIVDVSSLQPIEIVNRKNGTHGSEEKLEIRRTSSFSITTWTAFRRKSLMPTKFY